MRIITTLICLFCLTNLFGQVEQAKLKISFLTDDLYIFTTYNSFKGQVFPANGMYLVTEKGVVMFDSPWDTTQFQPLLDSIKIKHKKEVVMCIATHSHEDRTGGLLFLQQKGIDTYTSKQTDTISKIRGEKRAKFLFEKDTTFSIGQYRFQTYYGGQGHTSDNIVIWFDKQKVLYGGCLIKSVEATDLGNLADANTKEWSATIKKIQKKITKPSYVVPGHQAWKSRKSLEHTLKLIKEYQNKVKK